MSAPSSDRSLGELSSTVRAVLAETPTEVTSTELALAILDRHPEYGGRRAEKVRLPAIAAGLRQGRAVWMQNVRSLFDRVAAPVLHGRLVLIGLAQLDSALLVALEADGFYSTVVNEVREPLDTLWASPPSPTPLSSDRRWEQLSPSSRAAFAHAAALSRGGTVHTEQLLLGLYAKPDGPTRGFLDHLGVSRADLDVALAKAVEAPVLNLEGPPIPLTALPRLSMHVQRALELASAAAEDVGSATVRSRHLFSGLLAVEDCDVTSALADIGSTADAFRRWLAQEERPSSIALAGGIAEDRVDPDRGIPREQDDLGLSNYVAMMAAAVARRDTKLPLSIGLFGDWGSGKSYFMGLLREQVTQLAARDEQAYCRGIVQIGFNAWSCADSNLWASIGDEIFRELAGDPDGELDAVDEQRRAQLRKWLADEQDRVKELEAARVAAAEEVARLRGELDRSEERRRLSALTLLRATVEAVQVDPAMSQELKGAWEKLGLKNETEQARFLADTVTGTGQTVTSVRRSVAGGGRFLVIAVLAVGIVAVAVGVASSGALRAWLTGGGLTALLAACLAFATITRRVAGAVGSVTRLANQIRQRTETGTSAEVQAAAHVVRSAEAREQVLHAQLDQVVARVGELGRELVELSPGQRLYTFLAERAASEDYRSQQGLIAMIRRDFERLARLQKQWQKDQDGGSPRPIDRIVLYIDDLDRCTPQQVVDVLQAVHLLLALDLFVVVVGVDPRWLLHSLRDRYRSTLAGPGVDEETLREDVSRMMLGTPRDYLQKIFNVPFVLPPMTPTGFDSMLRRLSTRSADADHGGEDEPALGGADVAARSAAASPLNVPDEVAEVTDVALSVEAGSEVDAVRTGTTVDPTPLTEPELLMLSSLAPLVRSPREAKRLLNLYRMLRSTKDLSDASHFLGTDDGPAGEFQAVALLLGLLTASPYQLVDLLFTPPNSRRGVAGGLWHREAPVTWQEFLHGLRPREEAGRWFNDLREDLADADRAEWALLVERAAPASALVTMPDLASFVTWAPHVARFSFLLAPTGVERALLGGTRTVSTTPAPRADRSLVPGGDAVEFRHGSPSTAKKA